MWREGEMKIFRNMNIPEQGILSCQLTSGNTPWMAKGYKNDRQVWDRTHSWVAEAHPLLVTSKDGNTEGKVHKSRGTHSTFTISTNTSFVNYQRPRPYGNQYMIFTLLDQSNQGGTQDDKPYCTHNRTSCTPRSSHKTRSHWGFGMLAITTPHDPIFGVRIQEARENHHANMKDQLS